MPTFVLRAHAAPVDPQRFLAEAGEGAHVEYIAQVIQAGLFISKGHREDACLIVVMENSKDYSRAITLRGDAIGDLGGLTEQAILARLAECLRVGQGLGKEQSVETPEGIVVSATSFEHIARAYLADHEVYLLDRKGTDLRETPMSEPAVFLLTDHVPMPKNLHKSLVRQGAKRVSLGPVMLQASQCVVLVQNEFDRLA